LLAKVVKLEADIRRYQEDIDALGPVLENAKGTPVLNPMTTYVDQLQRRQLAVMRSMSLSTPAGDPRTQTAHALQQRTFNSVLESDGDGLLAKPN
jgi:hypothetical protein